MEGKEEERVSCEKKILSSIPLSLSLYITYPTAARKGTACPGAFSITTGPRALRRKMTEAAAAADSESQGKAEAGMTLRSWGREGGREGGEFGRGTKSESKDRGGEKSGREGGREEGREGFP